jgi:DNA polymerase I-like protein with 3'-5' exonuclease and polymerase domains
VIGTGSFVIAGKLFVSADYCQLELRVLAHLAKDSALCSVLKSNCDVFHTIAASWNQVAESDVSNSYFTKLHSITGQETAVLEYAMVLLSVFIT